MSVLVTARTQTIAQLTADGVSIEEIRNAIQATEATKELKKFPIYYFIACVICISIVTTAAITHQYVYQKISIIIVGVNWVWYVLFSYIMQNSHLFCVVNSIIIQLMYMVIILSDICSELYITLLISELIWSILTFYFIINFIYLANVQRDFPAITEARESIPI